MAQEEPPEETPLIREKATVLVRSQTALSQPLSPSFFAMASGRASPPLVGASAHVLHGVLPATEGPNELFKWSTPQWLPNDPLQLYPMTQRIV